MSRSSSEKEEGEDSEEDAGLAREKISRVFPKTEKGGKDNFVLFLWKRKIMNIFIIQKIILYTP